MEHFNNIGVTEIFLEATPTTFVSTILLVSSMLGYRTLGKWIADCGFSNVLIGRGISAALFWVGYVASIFSAAFGVSR